MTHEPTRMDRRRKGDICIRYACLGPRRRGGVQARPAATTIPCAPPLSGCDSVFGQARGTGARGRACPGLPLSRPGGVLLSQLPLAAVKGRYGVRPSGRPPSDRAVGHRHHRAHSPASVAEAKMRPRKGLRWRATAKRNVPPDGGAWPAWRPWPRRAGMSRIGASRLGRDGGVRASHGWARTGAGEVQEESDCWRPGVLLLALESGARCD